MTSLAPADSCGPTLEPDVRDTQIPKTTARRGSWLARLARHTPLAVWLGCLLAMLAGLIFAVIGVVAMVVYDLGF